MFFHVLHMRVYWSVWLFLLTFCMYLLCLCFSGVFYPIDSVSTVIVIGFVPHCSRPELASSSNSLCDGSLGYNRRWKEWQEDIWSKLDFDFIMMGWKEEEVDFACDEYLEYECGLIDSAIELFMSSDSLCDDSLGYNRQWKEWQEDMWSKLDLDFIMMGWEEEEEEEEIDAACDEYFEYVCGMIESAIELFVSVSAQTAELDLKMND